jgi:hypothetical protein
LSVELVAPTDEMWTATLELTLSRPDGRESRWRTEVPLDAESVAEPMALPRGVVLDGPALLVARVWFAAEDGRLSPTTSLGGRFVEFGPDGTLVPSEQQFAGAIGIGLIHDANDEVPPDREMPPLPVHLEAR